MNGETLSLKAPSLQNVVARVNQQLDYVYLLVWGVYLSETECEGTMHVIKLFNLIGLFGVDQRDTEPPPKPPQPLFLGCK